ncbi:hypothetical protein MN608_04538 [Microdochium nivale]|nr:hypothetical protein MN608_04538 [Microdochium nivale]
MSFSDGSERVVNDMKMRRGGIFLIFRRFCGSSYHHHHHIAFGSRRSKSSMFPKTAPASSPQSTDSFANTFFAMPKHICTKQPSLRHAPGTFRSPRGFITIMEIIVLLPLRPVAAAAAATDTLSRA